MLVLLDVIFLNIKSFKANNKDPKLVPVPDRLKCMQLETNEEGEDKECLKDVFKFEEKTFGLCEYIFYFNSLLILIQAVEGIMLKYNYKIELMRKN